MLLIAMTGWGQSEDKRRATEAGFDAHLVKPVSLNALLEALATHTREEQAARNEGSVVPSLWSSGLA